MSIRQELRQPVNGYAVAVILLVAISLAVVSVEISLTANRNSDRKLCDIARSNSAVYEETPPTTPTGQNAARNWIELQRTLRCPTLEEK